MDRSDNTNSPSSTVAHVYVAQSPRPSRRGWCDSRTHSSWARTCGIRPTGTRRPGCSRRMPCARAVPSLYVPERNLNFPFCLFCLSGAPTMHGGPFQCTCWPIPRPPRPVTHHPSSTNRRGGGQACEEQESNQLTKHLVHRACTASSSSSSHRAGTARTRPTAAASRPATASPTSPC